MVAAAYWLQQGERDPHLGAGMRTAYLCLLHPAPRTPCPTPNQVSLASVPGSQPPLADTVGCFGLTLGLCKRYCCHHQADLRTAGYTRHRVPHSAHSCCSGQDRVGPPPTTAPHIGTASYQHKGFRSYTPEGEDGPQHL